MSLGASFFTPRGSINMEVTKRNGELESYDVEKIHQVVEWATEGINGVSSSDIEMNMNLSMRDKISTEEIHQILICNINVRISSQTAMLLQGGLNP